MAHTPSSMTLKLWSLVNPLGMPVPFGSRGLAEAALEEMRPFLREAWEVREVDYVVKVTLERSGE